jgi:hypothetical protein
MMVKNVRERLADINKAHTDFIGRGSISGS